MKRKLITAAMLVTLAAAITSCFTAERDNPNDPSVMTDEEVVALDKSLLEIEYAEGDSETSVTQNVILPTGGVSGTTITWQSSLSYVSTAGSVIRPTFGQTNASVTLTATIGRGDVTATKTFDLTVLAKSAICVATSAGIAISENKGVSWNEPVVRPSSATATDLPSSNIKSIFVSGSTIYAGTNLGLGITTDGGATWATHNTATTGFGTSNCVNGVHVSVASTYRLRIFNSDGTYTYIIRSIPSRIYTATNGGLSVINTQTLTYTDTDKVKHTVVPAWVNYTSSSVFNNASLYKVCTTNGTRVETEIIGYDKLGRPILSTMTVPVTTVYIATSEGVYTGDVDYTTDYSIDITSWSAYTSTTNGLASDTVNDIYAYKTSTTETIYAATANGLSISSDGGTSWTNELSGKDIRSVFVCNSGSYIYCAASDGLWYSLNSGSTWNVLTAADNHILSNNLYGIYGDSTGTTLYVATAVGISISTNSGGTWTNYNSGLATTDVPGTLGFSNITTCYAIYAK